MSTNQGYINHIAFVLDRSVSMTRLKDAVVTVADNQIKTLAQQSQAHDQETRATVYLFGSKIECTFYDKDVLRLPSLKGAYKNEGNTRLIDATMQAISDLEKTATLYGNHSFMIFVLTDGEENESSDVNRRAIAAKLANLPSNWTVAVLVPNQSGVAEAKKWGFLPNNIEKWDTTPQGLIEVGRKLEKASNAYMTMRAAGTGFVGTSNIFSLSAEDVGKAVSTGQLTPVSASSYHIVRNGSSVVEIRPLVESALPIVYRTGRAFYQLTKTEHIQPQKEIAIRDKVSGVVFKGPAARQMLNLPDYEVKVPPTFNANYDIFVQSTSVNRKIMPNTDVLVFV